MVSESDEYIMATAMPVSSRRPKMVIRSAMPRSFRANAGFRCAFWPTVFVVIPSSLLAEWRRIAIQQCLRTTVHECHTRHHGRNWLCTREVLVLRLHGQAHLQRVHGRERRSVVVEVDGQRNRVSGRVVHGENRV